MTVPYALLASLWIALSDRLLERVAADSARLTDLQTAKGWLFVSASALGLQVLTVRILRQAQSEAVRANRLETQDRILREVNQGLEAFATTAAHDLKAPLRAVQSYCDLLLAGDAGPMPPEARRLIGKISGAGERMDALIQSLLEYSHVSQAELRPRTLALEDLVAGALEEIGPLRLRVDRGVLRGRVLTDSSVARRMVVNLLANAAKFVAADSEPEISIREESRSHRVRLWVEDHGIGLAEEHFETVFQPLRRLHGRGHYAGTGMGLAIVRAAARRLGGDAGVEANLPHGCRFWIDFPTAASTSTARPDERPPLPEPDQETPP